MSFLLMLNTTSRLLASWLRRDSFALKWPRPVARALIFPFLETFSLFVNDLFVFVLMMLVRFLYNDAEAFRRLLCFVCYLVWLCNEVQDSIHSLLEKLQIHILCSSREEQVYLYPISFSEPFGSFFCFEFKIVLSRTHFHLNILNFNGVSLGFSHF